MSSTLPQSEGRLSSADPGHAAERSLDPQSWDAMRALGHRMIDDVMTYLETIREAPVWQKPSAAAMASYQAPMPMTAQDPERIYDEYLEHIVPHVIGNGHPRFWGWVTGTGT